MNNLIEKRHIRYATLKYKLNDLEKKYQQQQQPQIIFQYVYNLITLFITSIIIFILQVLQCEDAGSSLWICGSLFALAVPIIAYMIIQQKQRFLYYHILWNILFSLSCAGINYLYLYSYKSTSQNKGDNSHNIISSIQTSSNLTYKNLTDVDLLLFLFIQETLYIQQAFFMDSSSFFIDAALIIFNRFVNGIIFGGVIKENIILNLFFYIVPIFLIFNRYLRELIERSKFLENNNHSEWVNIIDNMYNASLIVSRWDSRHQTIELIRVSGTSTSIQYIIILLLCIQGFQKLCILNIIVQFIQYEANAETKFRIFNSETMKNFYSRIQVDTKSGDMMASINAEEGKKISLKDYLLQRCANQEEQKNKKQFAKKSKINNEIPQNIKQDDSFKQEIPTAKRQRCKSQHQRNFVESETIIGYYFRQAEDQNYSKIFRIKVSNFQMNDMALVTSIEDITYQDDIKFLQTSKSQTDKLLLQTLNDFRIKLIPIITGVGELEKANLDDQYDNILETVKYNTYLIMNHIYILFDYFSINEKKGVTIKMASFSLKQMIWDIVGMFQAQAKMNSIQFIHRNEVRRMDKTFSDERRIKQVLITVLSNALNMIDQGSVTFKVGLDRNEQPVTQTVVVDSPTSRSHPSLKFEIEVTIDEKKKQREDVSEKFEQLYSKIESQVIDELVKTLGPYQIKKEDQSESSIMKISFAIYADFLNLRKEERLHSLIRPELSINYNQQQQSQRSRATTRGNALTYVKQNKQSSEIEKTGSSYLIQLGATTCPNERSPILKDVSLSKHNIKFNEENKEQANFSNKTEQQRQIDEQMREFQLEKIKRQTEKGRNMSLNPSDMYQRRENNKGQARSTTIRHGTNILNSMAHQSFLSNISNGGGDTIIISSQNGSHYDNDTHPSNFNNEQNKSSVQENNLKTPKNSSNKQIEVKKQNAPDANDSFERLTDRNNKTKSIQDWQNPSSNLIEDENLRPSEAIIDCGGKDLQIKNLISNNVNNLGDSNILTKFSTYFSQKEGSEKLLGDNEKLQNETGKQLQLGKKSSGSTEKFSPSQSPDKFIFMVNSSYEDTSQNYFLNEEKDQINESNSSQLIDNLNPEFRVKKISIFSSKR